MPLFRDTVPEFLRLHVAQLRDRIGPATIAKQLLEGVGDKDLADISSRDVRAFMSDMAAKGLKHATVNRKRATLNKIINFALEWALYLGANPVTIVKPLREATGRTRYLSGEETERLLNASPPHLRRIILVALHTGGRRGELLQLRWRDVDLERGLITFPQETTKSCHERIIPMSPPVRAMLSNMWPRSPDGPVFTYNERPIKSLRRTFQRACKKAGLDDVVFQTTRHSFASWFMMNGGGLFRLQKYLGHSTSALTQRYAHLSRDHRQDGVRSFSAPKSTADSVVPFAGAQASGPPHLKG